MQTAGVQRVRSADLLGESASNRAPGLPAHLPGDLPTDLPAHSPN
jgi:hypothetical protein